MTLIDYRLANGLTQADAAAALHVGLRSIQRWEGGGSPRIDMIERVRKWSDDAITYVDWQHANGAA